MRWKIQKINCAHISCKAFLKYKERMFSLNDRKYIYNPKIKINLTAENYSLEINLYVALECQI